MNTKKVALFDLDGVIVDTEDEYTQFWGLQGRLYHPEIPNFAHRIKGYTLVQVYEEYFADRADLQPKITEALNYHERNMAYKYVSGVLDFIKQLKNANVKIAIATSSNRKKMEGLSQVRPELFEIFDKIVVAEDVKKSKPAPDCYLLAAELLGADIKSAVIFEDSVTGLAAARASGGYVVGVSSTLGSEKIAPLCDFQIPNFEGISLDILSRTIK